MKTQETRIQTATVLVLLLILGGVSQQLWDSRAELRKPSTVVCSHESGLAHHSHATKLLTATYQLFEHRHLSTAPCFRQLTVLGFGLPAPRAPDRVL